jgi:hypothetical protein
VVYLPVFSSSSRAFLTDLGNVSPTTMNRLEQSIPDFDNEFAVLNMACWFFRIVDLFRFFMKSPRLSELTHTVLVYLYLQRLRRIQYQ